MLVPTLHLLAPPPQPPAKAQQVKITFASLDTHAHVKFGSSYPAQHIHHLLNVIKAPLQTSPEWDRGGRAVALLRPVTSTIAASSRRPGAHSARGSVALYFIAGG